MQKFTGLDETIWRKSGPYRTILEYTGLYMTILYRTIKDHLDQKRD